MLNYYLPSTQTETGALFQNVDTWHIRGVKENHGVYFEEIIVHRGLETRNVAIGAGRSGQCALRGCHG